MKKAMTMVMIIALCLLSTCSSSEIGTESTAKSEIAGMDTLPIDDLNESASSIVESNYAQKKNAIESATEWHTSLSDDELAEMRSRAKVEAEKEKAEEKNKTTLKPSASAQNSEITYILNTNTKKFHRPGCASVNDMRNNNKLESTDDRQTIIDSGYTPCGRCNP